MTEEQVRISLALAQLAYGVSYRAEDEAGTDEAQLDAAESASGLLEAINEQHGGATADTTVARARLAAERKEPT